MVDCCTNRVSSGKTYSYLLPLVENLLADNSEGYVTRVRTPRAIILSPSLELSYQVKTCFLLLTSLKMSCLLSLSHCLWIYFVDLCVTKPSDFLIVSLSQFPPRLASTVLCQRSKLCLATKAVFSSHSHYYITKNQKL